jgi:lipoprotein NlpI
METRRYKFGLPLVVVLFVAAFRLVQIFHHAPIPPEVEAALAAEKSGDFKKAITLYSQALNSNKLKPDMISGVRERRAFAYLQDNQPQLAEQDFDKLTGGNNFLAYSGRGLSFIKQKNYEKAVKDFDRAISIGSKDTAIRNSLYEPRALAEFYLGRFDKAETDFRSASNAKPENSYHPIWLNLTELHQHKDAQVELKNRASKLNLETWPSPVIQFYLGEISPEQVLAKASIGDQKKTQTDQLCEVNFYLGESALISGNNADATRLFEQATASCEKDFNEFDGAQVELKRLLNAPH